MASSDDDFTLLGTTTSSTPPPNFHPYKTLSQNDVVSPLHDEYSDNALPTPSYHVINPYDNNYDSDRTRPDPNTNRVNDKHTDPDEDYPVPYRARPDPNTNRVNDNRTDHEEDYQASYRDRSDPSKNRVRDKRMDREELSDSTTPYSYTKRSRLNSSSVLACSSGGGGSGSGGGGGEYRKDREEWSDTAIGCLLEAYTEKFVELNRGNLRGRDWEEVALMVTEGCEKYSKSVEQCKNKVDNLKKRFKLERHRLSNGGISASHWPWFKQMEQIVGNAGGKGGGGDEEKASGGLGMVTRQSKRLAFISLILYAYLLYLHCMIKMALIQFDWCLICYVMVM